MKHTVKTLLGVIGTSLLLANAPALAEAKWPSKPIRLVVGGPSGGNADLLARLVAEGIRQDTGQPVIVESKAGAAGALAVRDLMSNGKDGHTFLVIQGGIVSETPLAYKVSYDPFKDIKPLAQLSRSGLVLVVNKDLPIKAVKDIAPYAKTHSGELLFASYATGMRGHTTGVVLGKALGVPLKHVGYKGSPPALNDVMGGHVPLMVDGMTTALPLIKAGKLTALAVNYPTRVAELPNVPTFKEAGYPQLADIGWFGIWAKPDTPAAAQDRVRQIVVKYMACPSVQAKVREMGMEPPTNATSEALMAELKTDYRKQEAVLKSINYQPE